MSIRHSPKEYIAPYEFLGEWDEVLLGDEELFKEMTEPHLPALLKAARKDIDCERRLGNLRPGLLQPEELVGETLIQAWEARHGRAERIPLRDWLLEMQKHALKKAIETEKSCTNRLPCHWKNMYRWRLKLRMKMNSGIGSNRRCVTAGKTLSLMKMGDPSLRNGSSFSKLL